MSSASRIWVTVAGGVTTIVLVRLLKQGDWGGYSIAVSLLAIIVAATTLGVDQGIAYFVGARRWGLGPRSGRRCRWLWAAGTLGAVLGLAARVLFPSAFAGLPLWLTAIPHASSLSSSAFLAYASLSSTALATDRYEASTSMPAIQATLLLFSVPAAVLFGRNRCDRGVDGGGGDIGSGAVVWPPLASRRRPSPPGQLRRAISFGIKGYGANALQLVNYQLDMLYSCRRRIGRRRRPLCPRSERDDGRRCSFQGRLRPCSTLEWPYSSASGDAATREMAETKSLRHASSPSRSPRSEWLSLPRCSWCRYLGRTTAPRSTWV